MHTLVPATSRHWRKAVLTLRGQEIQEDDGEPRCQDLWGIKVNVGASSNPWSALSFPFAIHLSNFQHCLPDCEETLFSAKVSAAPFHRCDFRTVQVNPLCNLAILDGNETEFGSGTGPMWGADVIEQYRKVKSVWLFVIPFKVKQIYFPLLQSNRDWSASLCDGQGRR